MDELKESIKDRLGHPLLGSIAISFAIINWRIWLHAFTGDVSAASRVENIERVTCNSGHWAYILPVLAGTAYVIITPVVGKYLAEYQHYIGLLRDNRKHEMTYKHDLTTDRLLKMISQNAEAARQSLDNEMKDKITRVVMNENYKREMMENLNYIVRCLDGLNKDPIDRKAVRDRNVEIHPR